jgi:hypothetical protein
MKQEIHELIDIELYNFYTKIVGQEPHAILININSKKNLVNYMVNYIHLNVKSVQEAIEKDCKWRGIDVIISENLKDNEVKIVI